MTRRTLGFVVTLILGLLAVPLAAAPPPYGLHGAMRWSAAQRDLQRRPLARPDGCAPHHPCS